MIEDDGSIYNYISLKRVGGPMNLTVTGHRPDKLGGYKECKLHSLVKEAIRKKLLEIKPDYGITGMALGVDQWYAEICIELGIPFIAAIPFKGQENIWPPDSQRHYNELLEQAHASEVVCQGGFAGWKLQKRNEWMVYQSHEVLGVWDGSSGGTANCIAFAKKFERPIHIINPKEL